MLILTPAQCLEYDYDLPNYDEKFMTCATSKQLIYMHQIGWHGGTVSRGPVLLLIHDGSALTAGHL